MHNAIITSLFCIRISYIDICIYRKYLAFVIERLPACQLGAVPA